MSGGCSGKSFGLGTKLSKTSATCIASSQGLEASTKYTILPGSGMVHPVSSVYYIVSTKPKMWPRFTYLTFVYILFVKPERCEKGTQQRAPSLQVFSIIACRHAV